jgi:hypothetical protein
MNVIQHADGIYEIEDLLNDEEQELFMSSCTDDGWEESHPGNITKPMTKEQFGLRDKLLARLGTFFENVDSFSTVNRLRRLTTGEFMWPHVDAGKPPILPDTVTTIEYPVESKNIVFGVAIYLNDKFTGGELHYPDIELNIYPKPRSAVIHNAKFNHEVKTVTSGNRYSITAFIYGDETTKFNGHAQDNNQ